MNFLLLLDAVPNFHPFLVQLGRALESRGHTACYVMETPLGNHRYREHAAVGRVRVFSEFLAARPAEADPEQAARVGSWAAFFADFDRYEQYGVNRGRRQDWYMRLACGLSDFFLGCLRDWQIDAVIYEGNTNSFAWYANQAAQQTGAVFLGLAGSRLPGRHELHGDSEDLMRQRVKGCYEGLAQGRLRQTEEQEQWVAGYLAAFDSAKPDYMASSGLLLENPVSKYARKQHLRTFWRLATYSLGGSTEARVSYRSGLPLPYSLIHVRRNTARFFKALRVCRYFTPPVPGDRFFLYPLHFHPEASTSVNARWYVDEYTTIKNLAFSLPFGTWLYVKDHPAAVGFPALDFYRKLAGFPNVKLIDPGADTKQLIRDSLGVITLTSTMGYEALVLCKPVWVLGEVFYDFHPGCAKIGWNDALPELLAHPPQQTVTAADARRLVTAYLMATQPGALPLGSERAASASFEQLAAEIEAQVSQPD